MGLFFFNCFYLYDRIFEGVGRKTEAVGKVAFLYQSSTEEREIALVGRDVHVRCNVNGDREGPAFATKRLVSVNGAILHRTRLQRNYLRVQTHKCVC